MNKYASMLPIRAERVAGPRRIFHKKSHIGWLMKTKNGWGVWLGQLGVDSPIGGPDHKSKLKRDALYWTSSKVRRNTMEVKKHKLITYRVELDKEEADWLVRFIQNHPDLDNESREDANIRCRIFNALGKATGYH